MKCKGRFTLVLLALLVLAAQPSKADSFSVQINLAADFLGNGFGQGSGFSPTPVAVGQSFNGPVLGTPLGGTASVSARAGAAPGQLRLGAASAMIVPNFTFAAGSIAGAGGTATFSMDFVLSGPQGTTGMGIPVTFNTVLTGSYGFNVTNWSAGLGGVINGRADAGICSAGGTCGSFNLGLLSADSGGGLSTTGVFGGLGAPFASPSGSQVRVGDTFTVTMGFQLGTLAGVSSGVSGGGGPGSVDAFANFAHTLGFPTSGFVFNLPTGYTVNSLNGTSVVNNQFFPGGTVVTPEPNTLLLMGSGFFALCGRIALRRKRG